MLKKLRGFLGSRNKKNAGGYREVRIPPPRRILLPEAAVDAIRDCLANEIAVGHEGIAYLLGQTNGETTLIVGSFRPDAETTIGSFKVSSQAMARVVRTATDAGLQVVGQIHTHPGTAYHSDGDVEGARIAYDGYVSIVVPDHGRKLPSFVGAAIYFYREGVFSKLGLKNLRVINGRF
jgi:proteasome lid subunit RPN8/RPN11